LKKISIRSVLQKNLIAGILIVVPLFATVLILRMIINGMDGILFIFPFSYLPDSFLRIPGLGFVFTFIFLIIAGAITRNYLGQRIFSWSESIIKQIPFVRSIYSAFKQLIETLFMGQKGDLKKVVMVEFPQKNTYMLGFVTGVPTKEIRSHTGENLINVFIPTTPNPTTGAFVMIHEKSVVELNMTVEAALKYIISSGIISDEKSKKI